MNKSIDIHPQWHPIVETFFKTENGKTLREKVRKAYVSEKIFPKPKDIFNAFNKTPLNEVKVVILGQDPYHGDGQAHGLSFSVEAKTPTPPSLSNIYKEIENDIGKTKNTDGNLEKWAEQGVFLLNAILTVSAYTPASHRDIGWEAFTDTIIREISDTQTQCVFLLWGAFAKKKQDLIDEKKHAIFTSAHPSPLSAHNGFFGNKHFSKTNAYLEKHGKSPIEW